MPSAPGELPQQHGSGGNPDQSPSCKQSVLGAPCVASLLSNKGLSCKAARLCAKGKPLSPSPSCSFLPASPIGLIVFANCRPSVRRDGNVVKVYAKGASHTYTCVRVCVYI